MRYGEKEINEFDIEKDLEIWPNKQKRDYVIKITLPEFCCLCPRSGYPDFATIYLDYIPNEYVVELKAIKLYINSFMNRHVSHEDSINEIYSVLEEKLNPKWMRIVGDFNPRGNVHTVIEIDSDLVLKKNDEIIEKENNKDEIITAIKDEFQKQNDEAEAKRIAIKEARFSRDNDRKSKYSDRKPNFDRKPRDSKNGSRYSNKNDSRDGKDRKRDNRKFDDRNLDTEKKSYPKKEPFFKSNFDNRKAVVVKKDD